MMPFRSKGEVSLANISRFSRNDSQIKFFYESINFDEFIKFKNHPRDILQYIFGGKSTSI